MKWFCLLGWICFWCRFGFALEGAKKKKKPVSDTALEEDKGRNYILNVLTNKIGEVDLLSTAKYKGTKD